MALSDFNETFDSSLGVYATLSTNVTLDTIDGNASPGCATWDVLIFTPPTPPPGSARLLSSDNGYGSVIPSGSALNFRYKILNADQYNDGNIVLKVLVNTDSGQVERDLLYSDVLTDDTGWIQAPELDLSSVTGAELQIVSFSSSGIGDFTPPTLPITVKIDTIVVGPSVPAATGFTSSEGGIPESIMEL